MAPRYSQKTIFNMAFVRHLEFAKFRLYVKSPSSEWQSASVYQIWSKSDSKLRYGHNAIFKMAAVRHLEFSKIAVLVNTGPIWRRDIAKNDFQYGVRPPSWICKISILCQRPSSEWKSASVYEIWSKSDYSQLRYEDKIMLFSQWRQSAVLSCWKLHIWSRNLYWHVILHLCSKFRIDRPIWRRDIAQKLFSIWRPSALRLRRSRHNVMPDLWRSAGPHELHKTPMKSHWWLTTEENVIAVLRPKKNIVVSGNMDKK